MQKKSVSFHSDMGGLIKVIQLGLYQFLLANASAAKVTHCAHDELYSSQLSIRLMVFNWLHDLHILSVLFFSSTYIQGKVLYSLIFDIPWSPLVIKVVTDNMLFLSPLFIVCQYFPSPSFIGFSQYLQCYLFFLSSIVNQDIST